MWEEKQCDCFKSDTMCTCVVEGQEYEDYKSQEIRSLTK
jgi:hypothetical protein